MPNRINWEKSEENYGELLPFILDDDVTDIDINMNMQTGENEVWITHTLNGEYKEENLLLTEKFIDQFTNNLRSTVNKPFNQEEVSLEADTDDLRISILHESVTQTGRAVCIRKTPPFLRLNLDTICKSGYCNEEVLALLINCVRVGMNFVFTGAQGAGKTECLKFFSQFIEQRVAVIEDCSEIHYKKINPGKNAMEIIITKEFPYSLAIEKCMRYHTDWVLFSEVRGKETFDLVNLCSAGLNVMTTLHTKDVRDIPERSLNMMGQNKERYENDIYNYLNVGILVKVRKNERGNLKRYIDQLCFFAREEDENKVYMILDKGKIVSHELPQFMKKKFDTMNPFEYKTFNTDKEVCHESKNHQS